MEEVWFGSGKAWSVLYGSTFGHGDEDQHPILTSSPLRVTTGQIKKYLQVRVGELETSLDRT
jgi:hypothetical protein